MNKIDIIRLEKLRKELDKLRHPIENNNNINCFFLESELEKYERRCIEYSELVDELGRHAYPSDGEYFSDGGEMHIWFYKERTKYINQTKLGLDHLTDNAIKKRALFKKVLEKVFSNATELSFKENQDNISKKLRNNRV